MSCVLSIYTEECLPEEEVFNLVKDLNGEIGQIGELSQGVITKDESTIWIYYRGSNIRSKLELVEQLKKNLNIHANTEVVIDLGHGDYSEKLAADFGINFLSKYPNSIVNYGGFLGLNELKRLYETPIIKYWFN